MNRRSTFQSRFAILWIVAISWASFGYSENHRVPERSTMEKCGRFIRTIGQSLPGSVLEGVDLGSSALQFRGTQAISAFKKGFSYPLRVTQMALGSDSERIAEARGFGNTAQRFWSAMAEVVRWIHQFRKYPEVREAIQSAIVTTNGNIDALIKAKKELKLLKRGSVTVRLFPKSSTYPDPNQVSGTSIEGGNFGPPEVRVYTSSAAILADLNRERAELEKYRRGLYAEEVAQAIRLSRIRKLRSGFSVSDLKSSKAGAALSVEMLVKDPEKAKTMTIDEARHWLGIRIGRLIGPDGRVLHPEPNQALQVANPRLPPEKRMATVSTWGAWASFLADTPIRYLTLFPIQLLGLGWSGLTSLTKWIDTKGTPLKLPGLILGFMLVSSQTRDLNHKLTTSPQDEMWAKVRQIAHAGNDPDKVAEELSLIIEDKYSNYSYRIALQVLKGTRANFDYDPSFMGKDGRPIDRFYFDSARDDVYPILKAVYEGIEKAPDGQPIYGIIGSLEGRKQALEELKGILRKK